ncbi:hypothetical protein BVX97_05195 [bacterium E08(2017)]|nr:hypothetical protein BVX97_05195 [bacterium E08(2017)]
MKKVIVTCLVVVLACVCIAPAVEASDAGAAVVLSAVLPGTGEWYNSGFQGSYPFTECICGVICPLVQLSSMFDAAAGKKTVDELRFDFWTAPK